MPQLNFHQLIRLEISERASYLKSEAEKIILQSDEDNDELIRSKQMKIVLRSYLPEYFHPENPYYQSPNQSEENNFFTEKINSLSEVWISDMKRNLDNNQTPTNNVFGISGATFLSIISKKTRLISESLGHFFEKVACVSPSCLSPEHAFGVKLQGIDLIIKFDAEKYFYIQLKTAENTLTGSQAKRMRRELEIYDNPHFAAAIKTNNGWTCGGLSKLETLGIKRVRGEEFWSLINIPYNTVLSKVRSMMLEIENYIIHQQPNADSQQGIEL